MKLRNKNTGEIFYPDDWEAFEPKEPLIEDKRTRKAVRAWAEAVGGSPVCFYEDTGYEGVGRLKIYREGYPAVFDLGHQFYDLELDTQYTIAELCGEEAEAIFGYDKEHIEFAKRLMSEGITPHDLKEHYHDFEWVAKVLKDDLDKKLDQAVKNAIGGVDNLRMEEE